MKHCTTIFALLGTVAFLSGCNEQSTSSRHILNNPSPSMRGLAETYNEHDAGIAVTNNTNSRSYEDDWRRFLLLDRPSTLSPFPVVND